MNHRFTKKPKSFWQIGVALAAILIVSLACITIPQFNGQPTEQITPPTDRVEPPPGQAATQEVIPTLTLQPGVIEAEETPAPPGIDDPGPPEVRNGFENGLLPQTGLELNALFHQVNSGVVSIQVYSGQGTQPIGTGSGFVIDEEGHIVTNRHVVAGGQVSTVVFYNGFEMQAEVIGVDADSDLAILRVPDYPENVVVLPLGDSDNVMVGEAVMAIGNPFGLAGSMTIGVVSAIGRDIPTGVNPFNIPQAIQTDAAINPGNSGGPLLNMRGEVIGVNAQIATRGQVAGNVGVGFAIPSNTVRRVAPVLIETGTYQWPWLGVSGTGVNLALQQANNLPTQNGTYVIEVTRGSPAARAGLQGATGTTQVSGFGSVAVGGDVIIRADGEEVLDFSDLLVAIASHLPGEIMELTILRNGQEIDISVEMEPRPNSINNLP